MSGRGFHLSPHLLSTCCCEVASALPHSLTEAICSHEIGERKNCHQDALCHFSKPFPSATEDDCCRAPRPTGPTLPVREDADLLQPESLLLPEASC
ncbi:hypothetical protein ABVT39_004168 [Epinephelus coioides]